MHWGVSSDSATDASLLFLFLANNSLRSGSRSSWMSSHLGTKVPHGFDTELSPDGAHWSQNIVSTKWASAYSNGEGFAAMCFILPFNIPFTH